MLRNDVSYPYPVLRTFLSDYKESFFYSDITVETTDSGYQLSYDFSVNNDKKNKLFADGLLSYAMYICCPRTLMREVQYLASGKDCINIKAEDVHYQVEYASYIIAVQDINHFTDEDFGEGFENIDFTIPKGSIVGIGRSGQFTAMFNDDIIKDAGSIIKIKGSDNEKYMKIDLSGDTIVVWMPTEQSTIYKNMPKSKNSQTLLHSIVTIPALVEAIALIAKTRESRSPEDQECAERPWYLTIDRAIKELAKASGESEQLLYDYPLRTAQMIMKNNSAKALKLIEGSL